MRVEAGGAQNVEGILALRKNAAPKLQWETWVHGAEYRNKMTLEGVNAIFSWVGAVIMGWHKFQFVLVLIKNNIFFSWGNSLSILWTSGRSPRFPSNQKSLGRL